MPSQCVVCAGFLTEQSENGVVAELEFEAVRVGLCRTHAYLARFAKASSLEQLRATFRETNGRRSFVARRLRPRAELTQDARSMPDRRRSSV